MEIRQVGDTQPVQLRRQAGERHLECPEAHPPRFEPPPGEPAGGERAESAQNSFRNDDVLGAARTGQA